MQGDSTRAAKARELVEDRNRRYLFFPHAIFDEHPWDMLLHLFIALSENEVMKERRLIELTHASPEAGRRWLGYLAKASQLEAREDGEDVVLTEGAVDAMRDYLDPARLPLPTA